MGKITEIREVRLSDIKPYENNAKIHGAEQIHKIAKSIKEFGFLTPCLIDKDYNLIAGHGRVMACRELDMETVPCVFIEGLSEAQRKAYILADNRLGELAEWSEELIAFELHDLEQAGFEVEIIGFDTEPKKKQADPDKAYERLTDRFFVNPFSVFDSRQKWWQDRKRAWRDLGIKSEIGRGNDGDSNLRGLTYAPSHVPPEAYKHKNRLEDAIGREVKWDEFLEIFPNEHHFFNTSVFDPVVCEVAYRWYSKQGDRILDPFAGGSVRGIVASLIGRNYTGIDLSERQIDANRNNWEEITHKRITDGAEAEPPRWFIGDSLDINKIVKDKDYDLLFTCPPYADLEQYSDDPRDISNMDYENFCEVYAEIIKRSVAKLKQDAFAVVVVGDVRDKRGMFRDFVSFTIDSFKKAGMALYNEAILVTQCGALATVAGRPFTDSRKLGKMHQNILVFFDNRNKMHEINLEDEKVHEDQVNEYLEETQGKLAKDYTKVLTFSKGNPKSRAEELGAVEVEESFNIEL